MRAILLLLATCVLVLAEDPAFVIPHGAKAPTRQMLAAAALAWNQATLSVPLAGAPDEPGKAEALAAFALVERAWSGEDIPLPDIREKVTAALNAGSQDAMVLYLAARFSDDPPAPLALAFRKAYARFAGSPYPPIRKAYCAVRIFECLARTHAEKSQLDAARDEAAARLIDALASIPDRERGACAGLIDMVSEFFDIADCGNDRDFGERWVRDVEAAPIAPWWRGMAEGIEHINLAWAWRGSGWASTVTAEGWKGFHEHIDAARRCFDAAWKLHPDRPEPCVRMITVAMGGGEEDGGVRDWFERAVAAQMDCTPAYDHLLSAIQPRWGGSYESMLALGLAAAQTERFDTEAPWQCIVAVRAIYQDARSMKQERPALLDAEVYARCRAVMDGYRRFKDGGAEQQAWFGSQSAVLAWTCGMPDEALRQLDDLGERVKPGCFDILDMTPAQVRKAAGAAALPP